jgi:hypothetical protein
MTNIYFHFVCNEKHVNTDKWHPKDILLVLTISKRMTCPKSLFWSQTIWLPALSYGNAHISKRVRHPLVPTICTIFATLSSTTMYDIRLYKRSEQHDRLMLLLNKILAEFKCLLLLHKTITEHNTMQVNSLLWSLPSLDRSSLLCSCCLLLLCSFFGLCARCPHSGCSCRWNWPCLWLVGCNEGRVR